MKNILLASTALVAFAGAAFAEGHIGVSLSGAAHLGFNDFDVDDAFVDDDNVGFYADLEVTINLAAELDNGLTAAASIDLEDLAAGQDSGENGAASMIDYELSLTHEMAGLYYGDTQFAAERMWTSAGDMEADNFSEADGEEALRGEVTYGGVTAQMSYVLANNEGTRNINDDLNQLSLGMSADFGNVNVVAAYQEASGETAGFYNGAGPDGIAGDDPLTLADESLDDTGSDNGDFNDAQVFGISVGTSFAGADVRLAYADNDNDSSIGVQVSYPFGPVTATAYYVVEESDTGNTDDNWGINLAYSDGPVTVAFDYDDDQGTEKYGLEGSYDVGNGVTVYAGYLYFEGLAETDAFYLAGTYDLGSGASFLVSYAEGDDDEYGDEVGTNDYQEGTTVELSFEF